MKRILAMLLAASFFTGNVLGSVVIVSAAPEDVVSCDGIAVGEESEEDDIAVLDVEETVIDITDIWEEEDEIKNVQHQENETDDAKSACDQEKADSVENAEGTDNTGGTEDVEDIDNTGDTEDVEDMDGARDIENEEKVDSVEGEEKIEDVDGFESIQYDDKTDEAESYTDFVEKEEPLLYASGNIILHNGVWCYIKNGQYDTSYTGLAQNENGWWFVRSGKVDFGCTDIVLYNGSWWYVRDGQLKFDYTGVAQNENGWWRIEKGKVDFGYTGVAKNENGWWRIEKGKVNFEYTGLAQNENGWWYIKNGRLDWSYSGVVPYGTGWYCVRNGKLDWDYTGIAQNENGWWRIENGKVNFDYTGLAQNENGWWRIENGKVNFNYTGLAQNENGWYYVNKGCVDWNYNGVVLYGDKWYCIRKGKLDWSYTGVAQNGNGWWRIEKGVVNFNYTGLAQNENGWWYIRNGKLDWNYSWVVPYSTGWYCVRNGKLDWDYTGIAKNENGWWRIEKGKVNFDYTGVARNENGWWYVYKGKVDFNYTGIASNENGWWYIRNGQVDWNYSGTVNYNGKPYTVKNGSVVVNIQKSSLTECMAVSCLGNQMIIMLTAKQNEELEKLYDTYYVAMLNSAGTAIIGTYAGKSSSSGSFQISAAITSSDAFKTAMMSRYAIAVKRGNEYQIVSDTRFLSNPDITASMTKTYLGYYDNDKITSKKGLQGASTGYTESSGAQHVLLNVDVADMVSIKARSGYVPYTYKGKTYYFQDMIALVQTMRYLNGWDNENPYGWHDRSVTVVLLLSWNDELAYLIHPSARNKGAASYYAFNMKEEAARNTYEALFCYMGEKFGENKSRVSNWTLGNEVNSCRAWNYSGDMSLQECVENYAQAFQLLYQGVKRTASTSRIFISLDHCWNTADAGHNGKEYLDEFAAYMNRTAPSMQWNVNYHPYSQPLTRTDFWNDNANTKNSVNTAYISMKNIQVLTGYLSDLEDRYGKAKGAIRVILGEMGYSGRKGNGASEAEQAAALGYGYYIAMFNDRIDAYIIRAYLDDPAETQSGLYFGLMNEKHEKKQAFDLYKSLDTQDSLKYMDQYKTLLSISSWESAIPGFDARKLPAIDF